MRTIKRIINGVTVIYKKPRDYKEEVAVSIVPAKSKRKYVRKTQKPTE